MGSPSDDEDDETTDTDSESGEALFHTDDVSGISYFNENGDSDLPVDKDREGDD